MKTEQKDARSVVNPTMLPSLKQVEDAHIQKVLEALDGNKTQTARILGIDRRTLYRRLAALA